MANKLEAPSDFVRIQTLDDLKELAGIMKSAFARDDIEYTAENPNGKDLLSKMSEEQIQEIKDSNSSKGIVWNDTIFSLCCTENSQDDYRWHL